jgi:hypothetical protein
MRPIALLTLAIALPIVTIGQNRSPEKIIDSLKTEVMMRDAIAAEAIARAERLEYLLAAKEMSLRSVDLKDTTFQLLLAIQAHKFWAQHKGDWADIDIYRGLYHALKSIKDPLIKSLPLTIEATQNPEYTMTTMMADQLCSRLKRNMHLTEWNKYASQLPYEATCPGTKKK